jgi:uncharacterized Fe-S cluster protein YjdI
VFVQHLGEDILELKMGERMEVFHNTSFCVHGTEFVTDSVYRFWLDHSPVHMEVSPQTARVFAQLFAYKVVKK